MCFVSDGSPAAMVGIRFGDQIIKIDGRDTAGMSSDKAFKVFIFVKKFNMEKKILSVAYGSRRKEVRARYP